jgi:DNA ligase N terminus
MEHSLHDEQYDESDEDIGNEYDDANVDNQNLIGWDHTVENAKELDDPVAEGDEPYLPKPEPSIKKASSTKFLSLCKGLETVCRIIRKRERSMSEVEKLKTILKPEYLQWLAQPPPTGEPPESAFPVLRLLLPEKDGSRSFQMKEKILGKMYADAFGYSPNTTKYQKLMNFTNPNVVSPDEGVGDFSLVVYSIISKERKQARDAKGLSIGEINLQLDELSSLPRKAREAKSNHDWRNAGSKQTSSSPSSTVRKPTSLNALRSEWLRKIHADRPGRAGLSPVEHKWLVRILLNRLHIGVGWKTLVCL